MTTCALNTHEWIEDFRASVAVQIDEIHPMAQCICHEYFGEMHTAAHAGDLDELARLVQLTQDKIASKLAWEEQKERTFFRG